MNGLDDVRGNLTLPTAGANGVRSPGPRPTPDVIYGTGIVHRPAHGEAAASVELTATVTKGAAIAARDLPGDRARPARAGRALEAYLFSYFTGEGTVDGEQIYFGAEQGQRRRCTGAS